MSKTIQKIISFCLALTFIAICVSGCADKDAKTEEKAPPSKEKITMEKLIAANHPDARLEKADSFLLERSGDNEYLLYLDKEGTLLESFPHEETFRLTVDLSYEISKIGESYERNTVSYVSPEEEWYPFLLFPSSLSLREKIVGQEEKDGKILLTTRLSGGDYDASLNQEESITERCETVYVIEKESLQILSYETVVFLIDGSHKTLQTKIMENAEKPAAAELLIAYYENISTDDDPEQEEIEDGNEPSDSPDSSDSSSSGSSSDSSSDTNTDNDPDPHPFYRNDDQFNVLLIGNSYSYYWTQELWGLLNAAGYKNVTICNLYYSGCKFSQHWEWYQTNQLKSKFCTVNEKGRTETKDVGLAYSMEQKEWDAISFQQSGSYMYGGGTTNGPKNFADSVYKDLPNLYKLLYSKFPGAKYFWVQHWVHEIGTSDKEGLKTQAQQDAYHKGYKDFAKKICADPNYKFTNVPLGDAWQAVRHDPLFYEAGNGDYPVKTLHTRALTASFTSYSTICVSDLSHDGDIGGGQYLNACVWFEVLTNQSVLGNRFRPSYYHTPTSKNYTFTEEQIKKLQNAAHEAVLGCHGASFYK